MAEDVRTLRYDQHLEDTSLDYPVMHHCAMHKSAVHCCTCGCARGGFNVTHGRKAASHYTVTQFMAAVAMHHINAGALKAVLNTDAMLCYTAQQCCLPQ